MNSEAILGITNLSITEGDLNRYSIVFKTLDELSKDIRMDKIRQIISEQTGLTNLDVVKKHLKILEILRLLEKIENKYILTSEGKVLVSFIKNKNEFKELSLKEKLFYFKILFSSITKKQLFILLETVYKSNNNVREEIIIDYYKNDYIKKLWDEKTVSSHLKEYEESKKIPVFFEKRFRCMERWLSHKTGLSLLISQVPSKRSGDLKLDSSGIRLMKIISKEGHDTDIYKLSSCLISKGVIPYNKEKEKLFLNVLEHAYNEFKVQEMSDLKAMETYSCIILLTKGILLEKSAFRELLNDLGRRKVIESIMLGTDGKPAFVKMVKM